MQPFKLLIVALVAAALVSHTAYAQAVETDTVTHTDTSEIAWFGGLDQAKAEAERTKRPILLMSAAPQCSGAPGMW